MKTGPSLEHPGPSAAFLHSYAFPQHDDIFLREEGEEVRLLACEFLHSWTYSILRYVSSNLLILGLCGSTYLLDLYLAETWEGHTQVSSLVGYFAVCFWIIIMLEHSSTSKLLEIGIYFVSQYFWYIHMHAWWYQYQSYQCHLYNIYALLRPHVITLLPLASVFFTKIMH